MLSTALALAASLALVATAAETATPAAPAGPLDFTLAANDGSAYPLAQHRGKVVLLVNVASRCGLTPQYAALQRVWEAHQARGLVVIGVPANDFRGQEPGTDAEIREFCTTKFAVTFPLMAKISVKGDQIHPLYAWLTRSSPFPGDVEWNFGKFLIGRDGTVVARFAPKTAPDAPEVSAAIEAALGTAK